VNVLFLGQINLRKGGGRLLDAMRLLRDEPVELTLVGPAEIDPSAWADLPKVRWMGPVPRSEVARFYQEADVFILPTLSDGYALTQLEALSQGLPVIASRCCGGAVEHGRNGWVLEDVEPATLSRTLLHAMERLKDVECTKTPGNGMAGLGVALERIGNE
jgi:glycosyltransferase involved in cell wall biosynthesis